MSSDENREEALFEHCLGLPPEERETYLRKTCGDDRDLVESVLSLLRSHETAGGFLDELPSADSYKVASRLERVAPTEERSGDQIGRYRLLELIGEGAWGTVWIAKQTADIDRQVAIKILKVGLDTKEFLARFEAERQTLALMDHPNIAKVLDAGATERGRPYLVMELVKGVQILEFADKNRLGIRERVELFIKVCRALHHAHRKGVVHRDLKPSNILVSAQYDEALPKVIDFGVAKSNQFRLTDKTVFTSLHSFIGTPAYSSPEQLEFTGRDVDARSDIYSLGALLYELLCGAMPFEGESGSQKGLAEFVRQAREDEPARPSSRLSGLPEENGSRISSRRGLAPSKLESTLKGELDWIVLKCLEKDPSKRYDTAKDLADDLQAYLDGQAVAASSPNPWRSFGKTISRKRPAYAVWVEMAAVLAVAFAAVYYLGTRRGMDAGSSQLEIQPDSSIQMLDKAIAVLPLQNMSPDPGNAYFADGIQEEILTNLSKINDLTVIGRTSTLRYRDTTKSLRQIGEELDVAYLVEGSVQRAENQVRVTVQLIDPATEGQIWSERYTKKLDDVFGIITSVSKDIARELQAALSPEEIAEIEKPPTDNPVAYDFFMKARLASNEESYQLLRKAVQSDPDFFIAWGLIAVNRVITWRREKNRNDPEMLLEARRAYEQAKRIAPNEPRVNMLEATMAFNEQDNMEAVIDYTLQAIEKDPEIWTGIGWRYLQIGRVREARLPLETSLRINPFNNAFLDRSMNCFLQLRDWEEASGFVDRRISLSDGASEEHRWKWHKAKMEYLISGDIDAFLQARLSISRSVNENLEIQWGSDLTVIDLGNALISRNFERALSSLGQLQASRQFGLLEYSSRAPVQGSWDLHFDSLDLLAALIHFRLGDRERWLEKTRSSLAYLRGILDNDPIADPDLSSLVAICHALNGDRAAMEELLSDVRNRSGDANRQYRFQAQCEIHSAIAYMILGENEKALDLLENASMLHSPIFLERELALWFVFDPLKGNPRFEALLGTGRGALTSSGDLELKSVSGAEPDKASIAILPFESIGGRQEDESYAGGIHSTLITQVSLVRDLRPISRRSVLGYLGSRKRLADIARELHVANVLTGDVQIIPEGIRINAQLVEASTGSTLWAATYDEDLTVKNVFQIQSDIAHKIAEELKVRLSVQEERRLSELPTGNLAALEAFFRGKESMKRQTAEGMQDAVDHFTEAITLDPGFALAYANLGDTLVMQASWKGGSLPVAQQIAKAEPIVLKALELDGNSSEAHIALGKLRWLSGGQGSDPGAPDEAYKRAIELNPNNAEAYKAYASSSRWRIRDPDDVIALVDKYLQLDPISEDADALRAFRFQEKGQLDEAERQWLALLRRNPENMYALKELAEFYFWYTFQFDEAIIVNRKILTLDPSNTSGINGISRAYFHLGDNERSGLWGTLYAEQNQDPARSARQLCWALKVAGNDAERERVALEGLAHKPNDDELLMHMTDIDIKLGRPAESRARWTLVYPRFFEPGYQVQLGEGWLAWDVSRLLHATGERELSENLIKSAMKVVESKSRSVKSQALIQLAGFQLLSGNEDQALESIKAFFDVGGTPSRVMFEDMLTLLEDHSEYRKAAAERQAEIDVQLARIHRLEALGELAPLPAPLKERLDALRGLGLGLQTR